MVGTGSTVKFALVSHVAKRMDFSQTSNPEEVGE